MTSHARRKNADDGADGVVQTVLPHVCMTVTGSGALDVTVDGAVLPPPARGSWTRDTFADLLDAVTKERSVAVRVEVHEVDGSVFTDLIRPRRRPRLTEPEPPVERVGPARRRKRPMPVEVSAAGFLPGEEVAVAVVIAHTDATAGRARALLDLARLPDAPGGAWDVLLLGRISGTVHIESLP